MSKQKMLTIRMSPELYDAAMQKSKDQLGIPLATLVRIFLKSFITQRGVGFYVGDDDLTELFNKWIRKQDFDKSRGIRTPMIGQVRLKDLFEL